MAHVALIAKSPTPRNSRYARWIQRLISDAFGGGGLRLHLNGRLPCWPRSCQCPESPCLQAKCSPADLARQFRKSWLTTSKSCARPCYNLCMMTQTSPSLGILLLDRGEAARPSKTRGSLSTPETFEFPVILETVPGAWADSVVCGEPGLEPAYVAAAKRLVERGASAIISNCGFTIRYQRAVAAAVNVPVAMSSLLLLPLLLRQVSRSATIAVATFDSTKLHEELLGIDDCSDRARIVIGGIEGSQFWHDEMKRPPVWSGTARLEEDVVACVARLCEKHPDVAAVLLECTAFPMVSTSVRRRVKLPVYDVTDLARLTHASIA